MEAAMDAAEVRDMKVEDIREEIADTQEQLMRMRFQMTTGELGNHNLLRVARRKVARLKTILRERELADAKDGEK
jgi:large subunit ribosomal protein L29